MKDAGGKEMGVKLPEVVQRISLGSAMTNMGRAMVDIFGAIDRDGELLCIPRIYSVTDQLTLRLEEEGRIVERGMGENEKRWLTALGKKGWPPLLAAHLVFNRGDDLREFLDKEIKTTLLAVSGEVWAGKSSASAMMAYKHENIGVIDVDVFSAAGWGAEDRLAGLRGEVIDESAKQNNLRGVLDRLVVMVARGDKEIILLDMPGTDKDVTRPKDVFDLVADYSVAGVRCDEPLEVSDAGKVEVGVESIESQLGAAVTRSKIEDKMFFEMVKVG